MACAQLTHWCCCAVLPCCCVLCAEPMMSKRKGIIAGSEAVSAYDIEDSDEQGEKQTAGAGSG